MIGAADLASVTAEDSRCTRRAGGVGYRCAIYGRWTMRSKQAKHDDRKGCRGCFYCCGAWLKRYWAKRTCRRQKPITSRS